jgi:hypothetical protein
MGCTEVSKHSSNALSITLPATRGHGPSSNSWLHPQGAAVVASCLPLWKQPRVSRTAKMTSYISAFSLSAPSTSYLASASMLGGSYLTISLKPRRPNTRHITDQAYESIDPLRVPDESIPVGQTTITRQSISPSFSRLHALTHEPGRLSMARTPSLEGRSIPRSTDPCFEAGFRSVLRLIVESLPL